MAYRWKALAGALPPQQLEQDYAAADKLEPLAIGTDCLFYRRGLGTVEYLPFGEIRRAYRREEDSSSILGCCRQYFTTHYLVLTLPSGKLKKLEVPEKELVQQALDLLKIRAPEIPLGYVRPEG